MPFLVQHYFEHNKEKEIGIISFISFHYSNPKHEDNHEHENLPFKTHNHLNYTANSIFILQNFFKLDFITGLSEKDNLILADVLFIKSNNICSIWQPPQV